MSKTLSAIVLMRNRPFSSYAVPLFQNEYSCNNFHMTKSLIYTKINMQGRTHFLVVSNIFQHERSYSTTFPYTEKRAGVITSRCSRKEPACSREWRKSRLRRELNCDTDSFDFWTWLIFEKQNESYSATWNCRARYIPAWIRYEGLAKVHS